MRSLAEMTAALAAGGALGRVVELIVSTDLSIDVDDVGALAVAHALVDRGEARAHEGARA